MATFSDLKLHQRLFIANYPYRRYAVTDNPVAKLDKPLNECRVALMTTAGLRLASDAAFDNRKGLGDTSFREIPIDVDIRTLIEDHSSATVDHSGVKSDPNIAFPLDRFQELEANGTIGTFKSQAPLVYGFDRKRLETG